ncbi:ATP-dependent DNA helicase [Trichonephila clavipes]|nr:ATP-dependent DNA helicase [Trichonephila clavipes]
MLNDDKIVTSVQEASDPVDDETDEEADKNYNESSKGSSNADAFSALETQPQKSWVPKSSTQRYIVKSAYLSHNLRLIPVAINSKQNNSHVVTPHMDIFNRQTSGVVMDSQDIGDICQAECIFENGLTVTSVAVYISPNQTVQKIKSFLHFVLLSYTEYGSALLKTNYHSLPIILSDDFNVNFSVPEVEPIIAI